ncbi:hypothetical protein K0T92_17705 [Paenibacillus oenotherae]|uniref:Uncharacterized protein n=1 Tax=Paenibacillus oenotherae TaxID=1435645 RepID=A0ABS7DAD5_9BACL|nr:hypothetical protein [Paenibacillus oenotherae]MBW7476556.1 hypothetical protein [Paenibacillus oenotherae]
MGNQRAKATSMIDNAKCSCGRPTAVMQRNTARGELRAVRRLWIAICLFLLILAIAGCSKPSEPVQLKGQGIYQGMADTHSVEITTEEGPTVFQVDEDVAKQLEAIPEGKDGVAVAYEFREQEIDADGKIIKQLWLTRIKALDH